MLKMLPRKIRVSSESRAPSEAMDARGTQLSFESVEPVAALPAPSAPSAPAAPSASQRNLAIDATGPRALDLCAGAGGLSLGLHRAGYFVLGVDTDEDACETHWKNGAGPCERASIIDYHPPCEFEFVGGGVPCQSFSVSGDRGGLDDPRGVLYLHLLRIANEAKAKVVLLENVRGIMSWRNDHGTAFGQIRKAFVDHGFTPVSSLLDAADYGVPQRRIRLFLLGFRDPLAAARFAWPAPSHGPRDNLLGLTPYVSVREALGLSGSFAKDDKKRTSFWQGDRSIDVEEPGYTVGTRNNADLLVPLDDVAPTITTNANHPGYSQQRPSQRPLGVLTRALQQHDATLDAPSPTVTATEGKSAPHRGSKGGGGAPRRASERLARVLSEPAPCIMAGHDQIARQDRREELYQALADAGLADRASTTVDSKGDLSIPGHHKRQKDGAVRLTVEHCARLQGFPEGWTFAGSTLASQYRQVGNAVPPQVGEALGRAIRKALG